MTFRFYIEEKFMPLPLVHDRRRVFEILAVFLTGVGKFVFMDWFKWKLPFIVAAILFWTAYVVLRERQVPGMLKYWGFRTDTFRSVVRMVFRRGLNHFFSDRFLP